MLNPFANEAATVTASSGAATLHDIKCKVTTEALTTAAGDSYTLTLTNKKVMATSTVLVSVCYGSATAGTPVVAMVTPAAGSVVVVVKNDHASDALDGTLKISLLIL